MKYLSQTAFVTVFMLGAAPGWADVTADELWAQWQENAGLVGQAITADVEDTGSGLILRNITYSSEVEGVLTETGVSEVTFVENGDGTVSVELPGSLVVSNVVTEDEESLASFDMVVSHENLNVVASGEPDNLSYQISADTITMSEGETFSFADEVEPEFDIDIVLSGFASTYTTSGEGEAKTFESTASMSGMTMAMDGKAPEGEVGTFTFQLAMGEASYDTNGSVAAMRAFGANEAPPDMFSLIADFSYERLGYFVAGSDDEMSFQTSMENEGGTLGFQLNQSSIGYALSGQNTAFSLQGSDIPVPVDVTAASTLLEVVIPVAPEDEPSDLSLSVDYQGVEISEAVWGMFDPAAAIPRDPASLRLMARGTAQMFVSILGGEPVGFGPPGELRSANLDVLELRVAGAELTGSGAVTFEPGQLIPQPIGSVDVALRGLNALLDRLVEGGLVPAEQAGMARGVSGMFARPGAEPDTLETTIEFLPGGGITANGIPLR